MNAQAIEQIVRQVMKEVSPPLHAKGELWDIKRIAKHFNRTPRYTANHIATHHTFPRPIRLPSSEKSKGLYDAGEIVKWGEGFKS